MISQKNIYKLMVSQYNTSFTDTIRFADDCCWCGSEKLWIETNFELIFVFGLCLFTFSYSYLYPGNSSTFGIMVS